MLLDSLADVVGDIKTFLSLLYYNIRARVQWT